MSEGLQGLTYLDKSGQVFQQPEQIITRRQSEFHEIPADPMGLANPRYNQLMIQYFQCVTDYMNDYTDPVILQK